MTAPSNSDAHPAAVEPNGQFIGDGNCAGVQLASFARIT
jgi:hypothetical protein